MSRDSELHDAIDELKADIEDLERDLNGKYQELAHLTAELEENDKTEVHTETDYDITHHDILAGDS
jgi:chromosome segregation ATPase